MLTPVERAALAAARARVARLEARLRTVAGGGVSTRGGSIDVRTTQLGFPAELTAGWDDDRGYAWKRLRLAGVETDNPAIQPAGDHAVTPDDDRSLEVGARGWMEPGPDANGYYFLTAGADEPAGTRGDCTSCAWLADVFMGDEDSGPPCLLLKMRGGGGRCGCMNDHQDDPNGDGGLVLVYEATTESWVGVQRRGGAGSGSGSGADLTAMAKTCCGCGSAAFRITSPDALTAALTFGGVHASCDADDLHEGSGPGPVFTLALVQECCGVTEAGRPYVSFWGMGPDACEDPRAGCDNTFHVTVECHVDCPAPGCGCVGCNGAPAPVAWRASLSDFPSDEHNGDWVWSPDPGRECAWVAECGAVVSTLEFIVVDPADPESGFQEAFWELAHGGSVYRVAATGDDCIFDMTLPRTSGGGPAAVTLAPVHAPGAGLSCCDPPDTLYATLQSSGATVTIHRVPGATPGSWIQDTPFFCDGTPAQPGCILMRSGDFCGFHVLPPVDCCGVTSNGYWRPLSTNPFVLVARGSGGISISGMCEDVDTVTITEAPP